MTTFYELVCEDYTHLGGPMGSEYTTTIFRKAFSTVGKAKKYAENDHQKRRHDVEIKWKNDNRIIYSGDLLSHAYSISKQKIE